MYIFKKGDSDYQDELNQNFSEVAAGVDGSVKKTGNETIAGVKNFKDGLQSGGIKVLTDSQLSGNLTLGGGNSGTLEYKKQGKIVTLFFSNLNGKGSGGNESTILTLPSELRPSSSFEELIASTDRSTLNSASVSFGSDGNVKWRRNSSYGSAYLFSVTYQTN